MIAAIWSLLDLDGKKTVLSARLGDPSEGIAWNPAMATKFGSPAPSPGYALHLRGDAQTGSAARVSRIAELAVVLNDISHDGRVLLSSDEEAHTQ